MILTKITGNFPTLKPRHDVKIAWKSMHFFTGHEYCAFRFFHTRFRKNLMIFDNKSKKSNQSLVLGSFYTYIFFLLTWAPPNDQHDVHASNRKYRRFIPWYVLRARYDTVLSLHFVLVVLNLIVVGLSYTRDDHVKIQPRHWQTIYDNRRKSKTK